MGPAIAVQYDIPRFFFYVFFLYDLFVHTENWAPAAAYEALLFTLCATKAQIETWRQGEETSWKH